MTPEERERVRRGIACMIDHPSVYMGGPSPNSLRVAGRIMEFLDYTGRLQSATCTHEAWKSYRQHGETCPDCGELWPVRVNPPPVKP